MSQSQQFDLWWCFKEIWRHVGPKRRHQLALLLALMTVVAVFDVLTIGAVLPFLGILVSPEKVSMHPWLEPLKVLLALSNPQDLVRPLMIGFGGVVVLSAALRILLLVFQTQVSQGIGLDISVGIYKNRLYQPYSVHVMSNSSDVISGIWKADTVVGSFVSPALTIISTIILLMLTVPTLFVIGGQLLIVLCLAVIAIYALIMRISRQSVQVHSQVISQSQNRVLQIMQEGLGGIRDVLIGGVQGLFVNAYWISDKQRRNAMSALSVTSAAPKFLLETLGMMVIIVLAYLLTEHDGLSKAIPVLGAIALGVQRILPSAQQAYAGLTTIRGGHSSVLDVLQLLNLPLPKQPDVRTDKIVNFDRSIELRDVSFRYTPRANPVLEGIQLVIPKGARIGLVGGTGCGKSTLADLIMGLLMPSRGEMSIDGNILKPSDASAWMAKVAHVPQAIFLSDSTIAENIAFGVKSDEIDIQRVRRAAKMAQIGKDIEAMELKYDTRVGERGCRLSGGQRQRIGIARALYKRADVLVLDEATSALDNDTEAQLIETIESLGRDITVISIAHRLTTLRGCDWIVELRAGRIVRKVTFEQMMTFSNKARKEYVE
jgi:ATP-binding cassette subfamily B protein